MSEMKKKEIIDNLTNTITLEKNKSNGGNVDTLKTLNKILESVIDGTYVSNFKKRAKRQPKKKK